MTTSAQALPPLRQLRTELARIYPNWSNWSNVETWIAKARPFFRRHFASDLADFERLTQTPQWDDSPLSANEDPRRAKIEIEKANDSSVQGATRKLLAFLDSLIDLSTSAARLDVPPKSLVEQLPFRPYKRFVAQVYGIAEVHTKMQLAVLEQGVEEEHLHANGGRQAVVASIRRHVPAFNVREAQVPFGPAWMKLKPILVRCGLTVDDNTTLLDIKVFLDATAPGDPAADAPDSKADGDPAMAELDVILSWSGRVSRTAAEALYGWLPVVLPGIRPWISTEDIAKGTPWFGSLMRQLEKTGTCITCVTTDNVQAPWIYFEAGTIVGKRFGGSVTVLPYLIGVPLNDVVSTPLGQYQSTVATKDDTWKLVKSVNKTLQQPHDETVLRGHFDSQWPALQRQLAKCISAQAPTHPTVPSALAATSAAGAPAATTSPELDENDVRNFLEEWIAERADGPQEFGVTYSDVDTSCGLPPGAARRFLEQVAKAHGLGVVRQGTATIRFRQR